MLRIGLICIDAVNKCKRNETVWLGYELEKVLNKRNAQLTEITISKTELTKEAIKAMSSQDAVVFVFSSGINRRNIQHLKNLLFDSYPVLYKKIVGTILFSETHSLNEEKVLNDTYTQYQLISGAQTARLLPINKLIEIDEGSLKDTESTLLNFIKELFNVSWSKKYIP
jgi:hypothetical protein